MSRVMSRVMTREFRAEVLTPAERPPVFFIYYATGGSEFPFDMLRFDQSWPATTQDVVDMTKPVGRRTVCLHSNQEPNAKRWESFNWRISADRGGQ